MLSGPDGVIGGVLGARGTSVVLARVDGGVITSGLVDGDVGAGGASEVAPLLLTSLHNVSGTEIMTDPPGAVERVRV